MREAVDTLSQTEDFLLPWIVAESELKALAENHDALKDGEEEVLSGGMIVISLIFLSSTFLYFVFIVKRIMMPLKDGGGMIVISLICLSSALYLVFIMKFFIKFFRC